MKLTRFTFLLLFLIAATTGLFSQSTDPKLEYTTNIFTHSREKHSQQTPLVVKTDQGDYLLVDGDQVFIGQAKAEVKTNSPGCFRVIYLELFDPSIPTDAIKGVKRRNVMVIESVCPGTAEMLVQICDGVWDQSHIAYSEPGSDGHVSVEKANKVGDTTVVRYRFNNTGAFIEDINPAIWKIFADSEVGAGSGLDPTQYQPFPYSATNGLWRSQKFSIAYNKFMPDSEIGQPAALRIKIENKSGKRMAFAVTKLVVKRMEVPGDETNWGIGEFTNLPLTAPSGGPDTSLCLSCPNTNPTPTPAPTCPPLPTPTPSPTSTPKPSPTPTPTPNLSGCGPAICMKTFNYWLLQTKFPAGTVFIGGVNMNAGVSTVQNPSAVRSALEKSGSELQRLNQQYVSTQLNILKNGNSFSAIQTQLRCYQVEFEEATLTNGVKLSVQISLGELLTQTRAAILDKREKDFASLTNALKLLNEVAIGNPNLPIASCTN